MARRRRTVCSVPGCPRFTDGGQCAEHRRAADRARGTPAERGYGAAYAREAERVMAGATHCSNCGEAFTEENPGTAGHSVPLREGGTLEDGLVPQCRRCNYGWRRTGL